MVIPAPMLPLVFDLDGTLIDSRKDIAIALNHALVSTGREALPESLIASFVGDGARVLCARALGRDENDPAVDEVLQEFLAYYRTHPATHTTWLPHAREALAALASHPLALCTNKPRATTDGVLRALGADGLFVTTVAGGDLPQKKPDPAPLFAIAERLGVSPSQLVMIGDGPQDIEAGRRAGARTVGVRGGFPAIERLLAAKPDFLLDSLADLPSLVASWR